MAKNLNKDTVYRSAKPKDYTINDGQGLTLLVKTNGSKLWRFIYRFDGKQNRLGFDSYPETSLDNARRKAEAVRDNLANGIDPSDIENKPKAASKRIPCLLEADVAIDSGISPIPTSSNSEYCQLLHNVYTGLLIDSAVTSDFRRLGVRVFYRIWRMPAFTTASSGRGY